ncbi:MAG: protein phosphatase CheZ [Gemmatimonadota bacterium]|nr:protein phosphatase CheZ [Gemmatimonadota bacterium]
MRKVASELLEALGKIDTSPFCADEKKCLDDALKWTRAFFQELENFIFGMARDLEMTRKELDKSSNELLGEASEQLDKVTESTQKAASSVMDRVDKICNSQNTVFERIGQIRESLKGLESETGAKAALEAVGQIEALEGEIQMEAFEIMNEMQFQDITTQQIQQANSLIDKAEKKLTDFGNMLVLVSGTKHKKGDGQKSAAAAEVTFDPEATMENRQERQDLADQVAEELSKEE